MAGYEGLSSTELLAKIRAKKLSYVVMDSEKLGTAEVEQVNVPVFLQRSIDAINQAIPDAGDAKKELVALQGGLTGLNRILRKAMLGQEVGKRDIQVLEAGVEHLEAIRLEVMQFVIDSKTQEKQRKAEVATEYPDTHDQAAFERDMQTSVQAATAQVDELTVVKDLVAAYAASLKRVTSYASAALAAASLATGTRYGEQLT